ncbi:hypothetical protein PTSG_12560 [Salpingoeca rosetta]|uniref:Endonuclease n=1 Tax=Salpingoeca rosetta (strain ATCC 50818 / BSB-021) TaxID=946362 RepID=F2UEF1_SALR5|nr:uncharacterized protein PTSG_12560 [Salpingoeca rosetta]EGD75001.1 hypothetical protein PTSG_12560 [Salpingoeca rosetta]|eukprot:XP_004992645.1 hypothetical protein PTSG_12560 [Salpingoeca rosetta]
MTLLGRWVWRVGTAGVGVVVGTALVKSGLHADDDAVSVASSVGMPVAHAQSTTTTPPARLPTLPYGFPDMGQLKHRPYHVISYNQALRIPNWVCETFDEETVKAGTTDRKHCPFKTDNSIHPYFQSVDSDYRGSGYDRGHLAAAANHRTSQEHMQSTFFFSNIAPQVGQGFNRDAWNQLEGYVRRLTKAYTHVHVCSGPLFLPTRTPDGRMMVSYEVIGKNRVAVPTHFFKVVVGKTPKGQLEIQSFIMPNKPIAAGQPLINFLVPLEDVERAAGVLFFEGIPNKYAYTYRKNGKLGGRFDKRDKT